MGTLMPELDNENAKIDFGSLLNIYIYIYIQKAFKLGKKYMKAKMLMENPVTEEVV